MAAGVAADERVLSMVRTFDAPIERVFAAWTNPDQFGEWFGPHGVKTVVCEFDLRVGGTWRLLGQGPQRRHAVSGKYLEIEPPKRLVFTWAWHETGDLSTPREHETVVALQFKAVGMRTEMTLTQATFRDATGARNHEWGWTQSFEKLEAFLGRTP